MMTLKGLLLMVAVGANTQATSDQVPGDVAIVMMQKIEGMMQKIEKMMQQNEEIMKVQSKSRDCSALRSLGYDTDGVYTIYPMGACQDGVKVWCDMTSDGGGWTIFLSRQHQDSPLDFARTWLPYAYGFGNASGEYWMGNRYLHALTKDRPQVLKMDITAMDNSSRSAQWSHFAVADEASKFNLSVSGFNAKTFGDVLSDHNGIQFSTMDQDNDNSSDVECSEGFGRVGWWFSACYHINPTSPLRTEAGNEAGWGEASTYYWDGTSDKIYTAIRSLKMKIRPDITLGVV